MRSDINRRSRKIGICGYARHGKDTVAEFLRTRYGLTYQSSSVAAMRIFLRDQLAREYGLVYDTEEACFADRHNHRDKWHRLITDYNTSDWGRLGREIFGHYDIYVGCRHPKELEAWESEWNLLTIWVDASRRLPPESTDSNIITSDHCHVIIDNNGSQADLEWRLRGLFG